MACRGCIHIDGLCWVHKLIGWAKRGKREDELECGPMGRRTFATKEWPRAINTHRQCSRVHHSLIQFPRLASIDLVVSGAQG